MAKLNKWQVHRPRSPRDSRMISEMIQDCTVMAFANGERMPIIKRTFPSFRKAVRR